MKKLLIVLAVVLMAASAFASSGNRLFVQPNATFATGSPATTNNDDSCDIGTAPAATLLLPYFEVANSGNQSEDVTTIFSITNVSNEEQIAHVTVWSDWSFPVLDFNIWLTGYDVQGVNLYDILVRGNTVGIPPTGDDEDDLSPDGIFSFDDNVYHDWTSGGPTDCDSLPGTIPLSLLQEVQSALTGGPYFDEDQVGGEHDNMIGYITIDVASVCSVNLPTAGDDYFMDEILFDNVFIGEWLRVNPTLATGNYAGASPMVHIRTTPEGGDNITDAGDPGTNLPFTFYDRYVSSVGLDRRQPLPGVWAARYIEGSGEGEEMDTDIVIWREGWNSTDDDDEAADNADIPASELVRFDEHENPFVIESEICRISPCPDVDPFVTTFPETSKNNINGGSFPDDPSSDNGGWLYLNLNAGLPVGVTCEGATRCTRIESQNWVVVEETGEGRYGVDFDAAWLGNGCSADPGQLVIDGECDPCGIGPLANATP